MHRFSRALALLALALTAACSTQPVDGEWSGEWSVDPTTGPLDVTLVQEGTALSGKVNAGSSMCWTDGTVKGTITGDDVLFGVLMSNGSELDFKGTVSVGSMTGTFKDRTGCTAASGGWTISRK